MLGDDGELIGAVHIMSDITERVCSEEERARVAERIEHLNAVLRAIRSVNQLIVRERDRDRLLEGVCESLIEMRGYHNAWIAGQSLLSTQHLEQVALIPTSFQAFVFDATLGRFLPLQQIQSDVS